MMSVRDLLRHPEGLVSYVPATAPRDATGIGRVVTAEGWTLPPAAEDAAALVILPPTAAEHPAADVPRALARLVQHSAAGIVLCGRLDAWPLDAVRRAPAADHLALLHVQDETATAADVRARVVDHQVEVLHVQGRRGERLDELAAELEHAPHAAPARLTAWLGAELGAGCSAVLIPTAGELPDELEVPAVREAWARVRDGEQSGAELVPESGVHVLLYPASARVPHEVLAAVSTCGRHTPHADAVARRTAQHIASVRRLVATTRDAETQYGVRVSLLQMMFSGHAAEALQSASQMPRGGRVSGDSGHMAVIECAAGASRATALAAAEDATGGDALVAPCPDRHRHVLVMLPDTVARTDRAARALLVPMAQADWSTGVGLSTAQPYPAAGRAYGAARRALAAARQHPARLAIHSGGTALGAELDPEDYAAWAAHVRAGLAQLPAEHRPFWVRTAELALTSGTGAAHKLMGRRRSVRTIERHVDDVMTAMGLDPGDVGDRATAQLALQAPAPRGILPAVPPTLAQMLAGPRPRHWAAETWRPLADDPAAARLLTAWLAANCSRGAAARAVGISRNTVPRRLARAAGVLALPLTEPGGGPHDALWSAVIRGELPLPRDPAAR